MTQTDGDDGGLLGRLLATLGLGPDEADGGGEGGDDEVEDEIEGKLEQLGYLE